MTPLKEPGDLPGAQQKALFEILKIQKDAFRTSELVALMGEAVDGRSVGGVLGSLYRNGYLEKVQGGRDKMWKLSDDAEKSAEQVKEQLKSLKSYWY